MSDFDFGDVTKTFGETKAAEAGGELPKGRFQMIAVAAGPIMGGGKDGKPQQRQWRIKFRVEGPEQFKDRTHWMRWTVEPEEKYLKWLKAALEAMDLMDKLGDAGLNALTSDDWIIKNVIGIQMDVGISKKKVNAGTENEREFTNTHLNARTGRRDITAEAAEDTEAPTGGAAADPKLRF